MDPLAGSPWSTPQTVAGFVSAAPNAALLRLAEAELRRVGSGRLLDLGCGAGRNAVPLATMGWHVLGMDLSLPMLAAAAERARDHRLTRFHIALAPMDHLPVRDRSADFIVAHGIWNLARSGDEFRRAVREASRVATGGACLFVFTFSRHTLPPETLPVRGEAFVFTEFSGQPQCFLTEDQLRSELAKESFFPDPDVPIRELNRPAPGALRSLGAPVIYEGTFRRASRSPVAGSR
jgi:SAM-dependent methyltransferase